ncbi:glycosyl hydrolase family 18 protein [Pedobacter sp. PLR]|uniref:EndoS/ChiA family endoglycosidase n=1 Tax=Pedobacter sp. PLR TaxID=2994465 RepID=UPI002246DD78|nr:glycosyl hydrolase family 18 protein [Pedobacter sp. PLR]MCX2451277.1 glycosyl hydrolase family 18 protein [Pedobacter sp. PLR]
MKAPDPLFIAYWLGYANQKMIIEELPVGIDVINLFLINLDPDKTLQHLYLTSDGMSWENMLSGVRVQQQRGVKVMASIATAVHPKISWNTIADPKAFAASVYELVVNTWGLDGIDIDPEMGGDAPDDTFIQVIIALSRYFGPRSSTGKTMSYITYQYYADEQLLKRCNACFDYVALAGYLWDMETMINQFELYSGLVGSKKLLFGVQPGRHQSTSLTEAIQLSQWQPDNGLKGGMMLFNINIDKDFQYTGKLIKALKPVADKI